MSEVAEQIKRFKQQQQEINPLEHLINADGSEINQNQAVATKNN